MISKNLFSIVCALLVWFLGVSFYLLSFYVSIIESSELQSNIVLALALIPSACLGTFMFYKKGYLKPSVLALTFLAVIVLMDAFVTVPVFIIPSGGSYSDFFGDPKFYAIALELYLIVWFFGNHLTQKLEA